MISHFLNIFYQKQLVLLIRFFGLKKVHPIAITLLACAFGILCMPLIALKYSHLAVIFLLISGFLDTLDGSLARYYNLTSSLGAALDIVCDRIVEFAIVFGLYLLEPYSRGLWIVLMLGSILICVTSFLVVGILTPNQSQKSFHYSPGLIERAEAFIFFALMILFPSSFSILAFSFVILVCYTAFFRCWQFAKQSQ